MALSKCRGTPRSSITQRAGAISAPFRSCPGLVSPSEHKLLSSKIPSATDRPADVKTRPEGAHFPLGGPRFSPPGERSVRFGGEDSPMGPERVRQLDDRGFSFAELLVVVAIVAILSTMTIPYMVTYLRSSTVTDRKS